MAVPNDSNKDTGSGDSGSSDKEITPKKEPVEETFSKAEVDAMLTKVRGDEKAKHQKMIEEAQAFHKKNEGAIAKLEESLKSEKKKTEGLLSDEGTKDEAILAEIRQLKEQNLKLETGLEAVADESAKQIVGMELNHAKALVLERYKLEFPELVVGDTPDELEASAKSAKGREDAVRAKAQEEIRSEKEAEEQAAEEKKQAKDLQNLPAPISIDASLGSGDDLVLSQGNKQSIANLPEDQYQKTRARLLEAAKRKAGMIK